MAKIQQSAPETQLEQNPQVLIRYNPEKALVILGSDAQAMLGKLQGAKITNAKSLEPVSELMEDAAVTAVRLETFRQSLVLSVQKAAERFRNIPGFEDFEVTLTIKKWKLRTLLDSGIQALRMARANFLAAEQEKLRQEQLKREADQRAINEKAARAAQEAARKAGADKEAQEAIRLDVLATPAPLATSKALDKAAEVGATVRYRYYAQITDLRAFLECCLKNEVMFNTLRAAEAEIEGAFHKMASDQKDHFKYPGATFDKRAVDVSRGR